MARAGFKMPPLTQDQQRVDELGLLKEKVSELEKKLKRKGLLGKTVTGLLYELTVYGRTSTKLDRKKLLKLLTEEQVQSCMVRSKEESICLRVKRINTERA